MIAFVDFLTETGGVARESGRIWSSIWWLEVQGKMTEN